MKHNAVVNHALIVRAFCTLTAFLRLYWLPLLIGLVVLVGHAGYQFNQLQRGAVGQYSGYARVIEDPMRKFGGVQVVLEIDGKRYLALAHSVAGRRIAQSEAGNMLFVSGQRSRVPRATVLRYAPRHIVGMFSVVEVREQIFSASPLDRSANRLRSTMKRAADMMPRDESALFMGLVIGDDRAQSRTMINAFRGAGLSHLTAVSGQNVAFVLTIFGVYLRRARTWWRFGLSLALIGWFVVLTRAEPSVLRAATMASFGAFAFAKGRDLGGATALAFSVATLLFIDPMLLFSVGFWMSSLATLGLVFITPVIVRTVRGPQWVVHPLATTLGAQVGVVPITLLIFGTAPAISVMTNVLAVPVAGFVMLVGMPTALLCGVAVNVFGPVVIPLCELAMLPVLIATRWVWWVAVVGDHFSPSGMANVVLWLAIGVFLGVVHRSVKLNA